MNRLIKAWNQYWFTPGHPRILAVYRVIVFITYLCLAFFERNKMTSEIMCQKFQPISFYRILAVPCSQTLFVMAFWLSVVLAVFAALGILYKFSGKAAALLSVFVLGYQYNFHEVHHSTQVLVFVLLIVGFADAGKAKGLKKHLHPVFKGDYRWPIQLSKAYIVYAYFIVGLEKLFSAGIEWSFSENLWLIVKTSPSSGILRGWFLDLPVFITSVIAFWSLFVCEILAPMALISRKWGYLMWLNWLSLHIGISLVIGGHFTFFSQAAAGAVFLLPLFVKDPPGHPIKFF